MKNYYPISWWFEYFDKPEPYGIDNTREGYLYLAYYSDLGVQGHRLMIHSFKNDSEDKSLYRHCHTQTISMEYARAIKDFFKQWKTDASKEYRE